MKRVAVLLLAAATGIGAAPAPVHDWRIVNFVDLPDQTTSLLFVDTASVSSPTPDTRIFTLATVLEKPQIAGAYKVTLGIYTYRLDCPGKTATRLHSALFAEGAAIYESDDTASVARPWNEGTSVGTGSAAACAGDFSALRPIVKPGVEAEAADWIARRAALLSSNASTGWVVIGSMGTTPNRSAYLADKASLLQIAPGTFEITASKITETDAYGDRQLQHRLHIDCTTQTADMLVVRGYRADASPSEPALIFNGASRPLVPGSYLDLLARPVCSGDWHALAPVSGTIGAYAATAFGH